MDRRTFCQFALGAVTANGAATALAQIQGDGRGFRKTSGAGDPGALQIGTWEQFALATVPHAVRLIRSEGYEVPGIGAALYRLDEDQRDRQPTQFRRKSANGRWFRIAEEVIGYTMAGARGDGRGEILDDGTVIDDAGSDDTAAVQAVYDYLASIGGGAALVEARQFNVRAIRISGSNIRTVGLGKKSHVHSLDRVGRPNVFNVVGGTENPDNNNDVDSNTPASPRWSNVSFENLRISGSAQWGDNPYAFNEAFSGNGIRTRWVDEVRVVGCWFDHLSNSGPSIRDGARALVQGNTLFHLAQGIDLFYDCEAGRIIDNSIRDIRVYVGVNVEGRDEAGLGTPTKTLVMGNSVVGATTSGIDIIEAFDSLVLDNDVSDVSGGHPTHPGYSFGIQAFGSPRTAIRRNRVRNVRGSIVMNGVRHDTGLGISVGANSGQSTVVENVTRDCSRAACSVNDTMGTQVTHDVLVARNSFDGEILMEGSVSLREGSDRAIVPQVRLR